MLNKTVLKGSGRYTYKKPVQEELGPGLLWKQLRTKLGGGEVRSSGEENSSRKSKQILRMGKTQLSYLCVYPPGSIDPTWILKLCGMEIFVRYKYFL